MSILLADSADFPYLCHGCHVNFETFSPESFDEKIPHSFRLVISQRVKAEGKLRE